METNEELAEIRRKRKEYLDNNKTHIEWDEQSVIL
jgi:hypothetical protein